MVSRIIQQHIEENLFKQKVILLIGARQIGKTTLLREVVKNSTAKSLWLNADELDIKQQLETATTSTQLLQLFGNAKLIIIDEAQDIGRLNFERFFNYSTNISYGADQRQSIFLSQDELNELLNWFNADQRFQANFPVTLSRNFRNSKEILLFTRSVFPNFMISQNTITGATTTGLKPDNTKAGYMPDNTVPAANNPKNISQ